MTATTDQPVTAAGPSDDVLVRVQHLSKVYEIYRRPQDRLLQYLGNRFGREKAYALRIPAVNDLSFELRRGESIAIIGRNGSGKSTTLQMLAGTLTPSAGAVEVNGRVSALLELGAGFNPDYTGRQNLRINAAIHGLSRKEIAAIEPRVEEFADIGAFIDEPVRTYSSGMYVRLAFATAVHVVPDILLIDEALAVGDVFFQQKCIEYVTTELASAAKILVTHDLGSVARLADRCLVMDQGNLLFDGAPLEGIEVYTKMHLRERAGSAARSVQRRSMPEPDESDVGPAPDADAVPEDELVADDEGFHLVSEAKSTAPELMYVRRLAIARRRADGHFETTLLDETAVTPGDHVRLILDLELGVDASEPVFGYLVRDRLGNALFGQATTESGHRLDPMEPGRHRLTVVFTWPEVAEGNYLLTLGMGDGHHGYHHRILSWAQNIARFVCIPQTPVHGAFNNDLIQIAVESAPRTTSA